MSTRFTATTLGSNDDGRRLDRIVRKYLPDVPLSRIYRAMRSREITVNGARVRGDTRVAEGDRLEIADSLLGARRPAGERQGSSTGGADSSPLAGRIVHESDQLLVVNKAWGELTHGEDSLEELVRVHLAGRAADGISFRPGPVHRLDRNTSGLVIFGASLAGAQSATEDLKADRIAKRYVAIMEGTVRRGWWRDRLERDRRAGVSMVRAGSRAESGGKEAVTLVEPLAHGGGRSLVLVVLETGRTHQIRAQAAHHGHPLAGDRKYGSTARGPYFLHAATLSASEDARVDFEHLFAPLPDRFRARAVELFGDEAVERLEHRLALPPD